MSVRPMFSLTHNILMMRRYLFFSTARARADSLNKCGVSEQKTSGWQHINCGRVSVSIVRCALFLKRNSRFPLWSSEGPNIAAGCSQSSSASLGFTFGFGDAVGAVMEGRPFLRLPRTTSRTSRHLVGPFVWCRQVPW